MTTFRCLGVRFWAQGIAPAVTMLTAAIEAGTVGYGCFANAHMVGESRHDSAVLRAMRRATWVFPDGKPVSILMRSRGAKQAGQVAGPDVTERLLDIAAAKQIPVFLFGGRPDILNALVSQLPARFPGLVLAGAYSPPFRAWTAAEEQADAERIRASGAKLCLVALGCPKQELWMSRHAATTGMVCLGIGAAFAIIAGKIPRAPSWVRSIGMEWAYRWIQEPRRLAHRYTVGNFRFFWALQRELRTRRTT
jgi:N-acetylglucosaminyldiphosphoundecaprenol N-acetyl-beta-D-mannosaminyltransferase